jgi:GT2 family glycosyltransferase
VQAGAAAGSGDRADRMADHVVIGYVHGGTVRAEFCASLLAVCMEGETAVESVLAVGSGPNISTARNMVVRRFLEEQQAPWLLMLDTDMWFERDLLDRLIVAADPVERPVTGALCYSQNTDNGGGEPYSTMYELAESPEGELCFVRYKEWPEDACVRVSATGAACLLMHRTALDAVAKRSNDRAAPWFRESVTGSALVGEDLTFCLRCGAAGIPVHVHTGVRVGHMKTTMLI